MKTLALLLVSINLMAFNASTLDTTPDNTLACAKYSESFIKKADSYNNTKECTDLKYSILSFRQMIYLKCDITPDDINIARYVNNMYKKECD